MIHTISREKGDVFMSKKLAIINDLSGFGRCSLTAAISVTSAMGIQACPLPTAILSSQTGYPSYVCYDFTNHMEEIQHEWVKMKASFDGIYTGFVSSETQIDQILQFIDIFYTKDNFLLVDPVMGDNGITYDMFTPSLKDKMISLAKKADIITPNLTELCLLTNTDYQTIISLHHKNELLNELIHIGTEFCTNGPKQIIITGIHVKEFNGISHIGNLYVSEAESHFTSVPYIGGNYSGTGDLFASCIAAGIVKEISIPQLMEMASKFLQQAILDSVQHHVPFIEGVNYEPYLSLLNNTSDTKGAYTK